MASRRLGTSLQWRPRRPPPQPASSTGEGPPDTAHSQRDARRAALPGGFFRSTRPASSHEERRRAILEEHSHDNPKVSTPPETTEGQQTGPEQRRLWWAEWGPLKTCPRRSWECDLTWKRVFADTLTPRILRRDHPGLPRWAPNPTRGLTREERGQRRPPCRDRGRGYSGVATSQGGRGLPSATRSGKSQGGPSPRRPESATCPHLDPDFRPPDP